jgi:hypothetical protein
MIVPILLGFKIFASAEIEMREVEKNEEWKRAN